MKLGFLVATWLVHVSLFSLTNSLQNLEEDMARISEKMLSSITKSFSKPPSRQKRELGAASPNDLGAYHIVSIKPVSRLCYPAVRTLFVDISNMTYAICVAASTMDTPGEIVVGHYKDHTWFPIQRWFVQNAVDVAAFSYKNNLYVLAADSEKNLGTELVKIDLRTNYRVVDHEIHGRFATSIAVWKMKNSGQLHLAIANSNGYRDAADLSSEVIVYEWTGTYFDPSASISAYDVKDIEPFHIYGTPYLAIANFRRGKNLPGVDSEIFRFDLDTKKWMPYQKIATYGAMDWEFFSLGTSLGQEFFLAIANKGYGDSEAKSMIYKFVDDKFVPFQCLPTTRATSFAAFSKDNLFILAVANENDAVHIYQYDGWRFVKSGVQWTGGAMADGSVHLKFHMAKKIEEKVLILGVSNPRHPYYPSVFEISFVHENPLGKWQSQSTEWCLNMLEKLDVDLDKTLGFDNVIFTDQPSVTIKGDVIFENGFVTNSLRTSEFKDISTEEIFDYNLINKLASLQVRLDNIKRRLEELSGSLNNSLKIDGHQTVLSSLKFKDASFICKSQSCHFRNINTEFLNGENIVDWTNRMVFTDREQSISGTLRAREINASSVNVLGSVDGVKSENLVTKSGKHDITGYKIFNSTISAEDLNVAGTVDNIVISPDTILLSTGHQKVTGHKYFKDLSTKWLKADKVNNKDLSAFYKDLVLNGKSYEISGVKTFKDVAVDQLTMTAGSKINEVDLVELWEKALWTDGIQEMKADITFADVVLQKNLDVGLGINGIQIPGPKIVDITESAIFEAPQTFVNSTYIRNLNVLKSLNGITVFTSNGSTQLDIFLKTGDQVVTGSKVFHTINLDADSDVKGYVDGVDLSELQATVLRRNGSIVTNGTWVFEKLSIKGPLTVQGTISNVDLNEVYERALKLNDSVISSITFKENIIVEDLQSPNINGINIEKDFVLTYKPQTISGNIRFSDLVLEENSLILGLVNNIDMSFLNDILLIIGNQHIKSKTFNRNVIINHLTVEGSINNISIADIVSLQGGEIYGSRVLDGNTFTLIDAKNIEVTGKVNGINITEMVADTMTYYDSQEVVGEKNVLGTIHVLDDSNLQTNDLNGININDLWADAVFVDVEQKINSTIIFKDNVVFDSLSFKGTIDGVSDWEIKNWMLKNEPQVVEGNSVFMNGFTANDLNVDLVNNLDLKYLESNIVKVNEISEITGPVIFEKSISSLGDIGVTGKVNGIKLSEEVVLKHDSVYVSGEKTFSGDVIIDGSLTVDGLINNIDIEDICNKAFVKSSDINVTRLVIKGDVVIETGTVEGNIAGVELSRLKDAVVIDDGSIRFSGLKTFENLTFEGPVTVKGKFGSIDFNELVQNYMSLSKDQEVSSRMQFDDANFEGVVYVTELTTADGKINNINIRDLSDRILKTSRTQNVTVPYYIDEVHFENDVYVMGRVNGIELPSGVMRRNRPNYIQSPKIFQQTLVILGNLDIENGKTIQGVDVSEWFAKAVMLTGDFEINGQKTFNELILNDVKVEGMLDGLKISEESLLMVYGDQVVKGRKVISGNVVITGSLVVNGLINTVDIKELANRAVLRDRSSNITGLKIFKQPLTTISLEAPTVSGIDVLELKRKVDTNFSTNTLEDGLEEIEAVMSRMKERFNNQATLFQYYELYQEFALPTTYDWLYVSGTDSGELLLLLDSASSKEPCSSIRIFGFDEASNSFIPARQELSTSNAVAVKSLILKSTFLFVANKNPNLPCSENSSLGKTTIDVYSWQVDSFKKQLSLAVPVVDDIAVFKDETKACLVVLEENAVVHCSEDYSEWLTNEILVTKGGQKVSILQSHKTIMAITADDISYVRKNFWEGERSVDVYFWDSTKKQFSTPRQVIRSTYTQSVVLAKHSEGASEEVFLILAEGSIPRIHNKPKIIIYRLEAVSEVFKKYQVIEDNGNVEWILLRTGEMILFVVDSLQGLVKVYQHKGVSGFMKIDTIKSSGVSKVHPFVRPGPEDYVNHYLALTGRHLSLDHPMQGEVFTKILKSKMKGRHLLF